jgi:GNAT superfamily N-acetyltransferase
VPLVSDLDPGERLVAHLAGWLGAWSLPVDGIGAVTDDTELVVVGSDRRVRPGWDAKVHAVVGVVGPDGGVLSVPPDKVDAVRALGPDVAGGRVTVGALSAGLAAAVGRPHARVDLTIFRWTGSPSESSDAGEWVSPSDPRVPSWLRPFNGDVLIAWDDDGRYGAGVGRKMHDRFGHELAVGTEEALRGRGLARRLVAQAARRVLEDGAVPTYVHEVSNVASGHVAEAAGFADRGWRAMGLAEPASDAKKSLDTDE